ncbi:hypothetical protein EYC80_006935 [Monilinia laxa]|uniref:Uncharacterized protein n=1 Tax=Monilinia laxa TaxID=61186 RepID=A0A5N6JZL9_MONLA|nr:hypothetical protein EYC80_006935 [Monilinia laxa]
MRASLSFGSHGNFRLKFPPLVLPSIRLYNTIPSSPSYPIPFNSIHLAINQQNRYPIALILLRFFTMMLEFSTLSSSIPPSQSSTGSQCLTESFFPIKASQSTSITPTNKSTYQEKLYADIKTPPQMQYYQKRKTKLVCDESHHAHAYVLVSSLIGRRRKGNALSLKPHQNLILYFISFPREEKSFL